MEIQLDNVSAGCSHHTNLPRIRRINHPEVDQTTSQRGHVHSVVTANYYRRRPQPGVLTQLVPLFGDGIPRKEERASEVIDLRFQGLIRLGDSPVHRVGITHEEMPELVCGRKTPPPNLAGAVDQGYAQTVDKHRSGVRGVWAEWLGEDQKACCCQAINQTGYRVVLLTVDKHTRLLSHCLGLFVRGGPIPRACRWHSFDSTQRVDEADFLGNLREYRVNLRIYDVQALRGPMRDHCRERLLKKGDHAHPERICHIGQLNRGYLPVARFDLIHRGPVQTDSFSEHLLAHADTLSRLANAGTEGLRRHLTHTCDFGTACARDARDAIPALTVRV